MQSRTALFLISLLALGLLSGASPGPGNQVQQLPNQSFQLTTAAFSVNTTDDIADPSPDGSCDNGSGKCSLREAIQEANAKPGPNAIVFQCSAPPPACVYKLQNGVLAIDGDLTITGKGKDITFIDGNQISQVFRVSSGKNATFKKLTIQNGFIDETFGSGGGIEFNGDNLTITESRITLNKASEKGGGGIDVTQPTAKATISLSEISGNEAFGTFGSAGGIDFSGAELTISDSVISGNKSATRGGGGIKFNNPDGRLTVTRSQINGNEANGTFGAGGAIVFDGFELVVSQSEIKGNKSKHHGGGGIDVPNPNAKVTIIDSEISENEASGTFGKGGGIVFAGAELTVSKSSISKNKASTSGGGIRTYTGLLNLTNTTLSGNTAATEGGAIANGTTAKLLNVTLSGNSAATGGGLFTDSGFSTSLKNSLIANSTGGNCGGEAVVSEGHNLDSETTCGLKGSGDQSGKDPLLGPLQINMGTTLNHALSDASPAVSAGTNEGAPVTDQRGLPRPQPQGGVADIGAFEASVGPVALVSETQLVFPEEEVGTTSETKKVTVSNAGNADLKVGSLSLNPSDHFKISEDFCSQQSIAPNSTCTVSVAFAPSSAQDLVSNLEVPTNGGDKQVALKGSGVTPPKIDAGGGGGSGSGGTGNTGGTDSGGGGNIVDIVETKPDDKDASGTGDAPSSTGAAGGCSCRLIKK